MNHFLVYVAVFIVGEMAAAFLFYFIRRSLAKGQDKPVARLAIFKGVLERLVLFVGLVNEFASVLIVFGTLKISTRLHEDNKCPVTNDYFLIGNLCTILIAIVMVVVAKRLCT